MGRGRMVVAVEAVEVRSMVAAGSVGIGGFDEMLEVAGIED